MSIPSGGGESRNSSWSASLEREGEYQVPGGGASPMFERPIPPPIPSRQTSINRDTGIWVGYLFGYYINSHI